MVVTSEALVFIAVFVWQAQLIAAVRGTGANKCRVSLIERVEWLISRYGEYESVTLITSGDWC